MRCVRTPFRCGSSLKSQAASHPLLAHSQRVCPRRTTRASAKLGDEKGLDSFLSPENDDIGLNQAEDKLMNEDMKDLSSKYASKTEAAQDPMKSLQDAAMTVGDTVQDVVDKILISDFFFIVFVMFWGLAGLGETAAIKTTVLIDAWLPLWPTVFQPALGVLMLGTVVQGTYGYMKDNTR